MLVIAYLKPDAGCELTAGILPAGLEHGMDKAC